MWQEIVKYLWLFVMYRAQMAHKRHYHKSKSRHAKKAGERIKPWVPTVRKIEVIISGPQMIVRHSVVRV